MTKHEEAIQVFKQGIRFGGSRLWAAADAIETLLEDENLTSDDTRGEALRRLQIAVGAIVGGERGAEDPAFEEVLG